MPSFELQTIDISVTQETADAARAAGFAADAKDARDLAELWASAGEGVEVQDGKYSALHHRLKAEEAQQAAETAQSSAETAANSAGQSATAASEDASDAQQHAQASSSFTDSDGDTYDKGAKGYAQDAAQETQQLGGTGVSDEWLRELIQSFAATSTTRDGEGRISSQQGTYRDGSTGTMTITRAAGGAVDTIEHDHDESGKTITENIQRDGEGRYESTQISIATQ